MRVLINADREFDTRYNVTLRQSYRVPRLIFSAYSIQVFYLHLFPTKEIGIEFVEISVNVEFNLPVTTRAKSCGGKSKLQASIKIRYEPGTGFDKRITSTFASFINDISVLSFEIGVEIELLLNGSISNAKSINLHLKR